MKKTWTVAFLAIGIMVPTAQLAAAQQGVGNALAGEWRITGVDGVTLGTFEVEHSGEAHLRVWLSMGGNVADEGPVRVRRATKDAFDLSLRAANGTDYRLLVPVTGSWADTMSGSLFDGTRLKPVSLARTQGSGPQTLSEDDLVADEPEEFDLPGVGMSGPAYRLTGVPAGRRLAVRERGDRGASTIATLDASATEILVNGCEPYVEAYKYEELSDAGKRQVLDSSWCEIHHEDVRGFIPGRYLQAIVR